MKEGCEWRSEVFDVGWLSSVERQKERENETDAVRERVSESVRSKTPTAQISLAFNAALVSVVIQWRRLTKQSLNRPKTTPKQWCHLSAIRFVLLNT